MCQSKSLARPWGSAGIQQHFEAKSSNVLEDGPWITMCCLKQKNKHILTVMLIDVGIVRLIPVPDQTAHTTTEALWNHIVPMFGVPNTILADQGPAYVENYEKTSRIVRDQDDIRQRAIQEEIV